MNQICFRTCSEEKTRNKNWSSGPLTAQSGSGGAAGSCQSSSQKDWQTDFDRSQSCAEELVALELGNRSACPSTMRQHVRTKLVTSLCCVEVRTLFSMVRPLWWTTIIRGYLANVRIRRHYVVKSWSVLRPPFKKFSKGVAFFPLHIGDHIFIEEDCVASAAHIGSYVQTGKNCVTGRQCVLKGYCKILDNTVLPPETVVPPFTIFSGCPGLYSGELPECTQELMIDITKSDYQQFLPLTQV